MSEPPTTPAVSIAKFLPDHAVVGVLPDAPLWAEPLWAEERSGFAANTRAIEREAAIRG
jgi:hypothetical protein